MPDCKQEGGSSSATPEASSSNEESKTAPKNNVIESDSDGEWIVCFLFKWRAECHHIKNGITITSWYVIYQCNALWSRLFHDISRKMCAREKDIAIIV